MLLHAFWWDVYIVFKKKRETCAFLSHLIYNFTVYIVNITASPYVEYSIKHFYFNHLVGILEKKKKSVFPTRHVLCIGSQRRIYSTCWHQDGAKWRPECIIHCERLMELTTWMLERVHLLSSFQVKLFDFASFFLFLFFFNFLFFHHCSHGSKEKEKKTTWKVFLIL